MPRPMPVLLALVFASPIVSTSPGSSQSVNSPLDLVQIQLVVPAKVTIGKTFRVMDEVENQGTSITPPTETWFHLSADKVLDEKDPVVGGRRVPRLGARQSHSTVTPVTLKPGIAPGDYYFLAVADGKHEIEDRSREDNVRAVPIKVLPADDGQKK